MLATKLVLPGDTEESALTLNGKKKNLRRKDFDALAAALEIPAKARVNAYARFGAIRKSWKGDLGKSVLTDALRKRFQALIDGRLPMLKPTL